MTVNVRELKNDTGMLDLYNAPLGMKSPIAVDVSSVDYVPTVDIRQITSTGGSTIKCDLVTKDGLAEGISIPAGGALKIINVTKIYSEGTDAQNILLWPSEF